MTCQWCTEYRRRGGKPVCVSLGGDGSTLPGKASGPPCPRFRPRMSCTTCEHRCPPSEKGERIGADGRCAMWKLREVESWGGYRKTPDWRTRTPKAKTKEEP